ncbi:M42 family peptidase [bacterium]|nr:MAG: M42 family peptidase [bacterium]
MELERLSNLPGVSGNEQRVRDFIYKKLKGKAKHIETDAMGNLYAYFPSGRKNAKKVMLAAHMDEVGLMITGIESSGELRFHPVGGISTSVLLAKPVRIGEEGIPGVIESKAIHLLKDEELGHYPKIEQLRIDAGFSSKDEAEKKVKLGDYAYFDTSFKSEGDRFIGKAFDDRVGCSLLLDLASEKFPFDLVLTFTVQEEVGLRGARVAGYKIFPDAAIAVEGTAAGDFPIEKDTGAFPELKKGPVLTVMDRSIIVDKNLLKHFIKTAEREKIPYQFKRPNIGGTDAGRIHLSKTGVPSMVIAVPIRYIHAPAGIMRGIDYRNTLKLLKGALKNIEEVI